MNRFGLVLLLGLASCSSKEVIVVYSPHGPDVGKDYEAMFEAAHPDIDLRWLDMGSQEVYNRISAERRRPACDVWWGAPSTMFMQAARAGLLDAYTPTWADAVGEGYKDEDGLWYGTYNTPLAIMFNTRKYTREQVPQSWDELLAPEWDGLITIRKPLPSGTMRTFIGAMILRAKSEDSGIEWLRRLHLATENYMAETGIPFMHVTHDLAEALRLGDHLVLLDAGRVVQTGPPTRVITQPESIVAARAVGTENLIAATVVRHDPDRGCSEVEFDGTTVQTVLLQDPPGSRVALGLRAEDVLLSLRPLSETSARNVLPGTIASVESQGAAVKLCVETPAPLRVIVTPASRRELGLEPGKQVYLLIKAVAFHRLV